MEPSAKRTGDLMSGYIGEGGRRKYPGRQRRIRSAIAAIPAQTPFSRVARITKFEQLSEKMHRLRKAVGAMR